MGITIASDGSVMKGGCFTGYKIGSDGTIMKNGCFTSVSLRELLG